MGRLVRKGGLEDILKFRGVGREIDLKGGWLCL